MTRHAICCAVVLFACANVTHAAFVVSNTNDSGGGSLRLAITNANGAAGSTITFTTTGTITLLSPLPPITVNMTITGPGAANLTVSGNDLFRVFEVDAGTVSISGLTVAHAMAVGGTGGTSNFAGGAGGGGGLGYGGGLLVNNGTVTLSNMIFDTNVAQGGTGGGGATGSGGAGGGGGGTSTAGGDVAIGSTTGGNGGINGGGGGGGPTLGTGGAPDGQNGTNAVGGAGGFGGGGGGAPGSQTDAPGGAGGFGGGGGGGGNSSGPVVGGLGGTGGAFAGTGGQGGDPNTAGGGGGGAGLGGAMYIAAGSVQATNCVFTNCKALGGNGGPPGNNVFGQAGGDGMGAGGVAYLAAAGTSLTLITCTLDTGKADGFFGFGGAIYNSGGTVSLSNSIVRNFIAGSVEGGGGGIYNTGALTLTNSTLSGNYSQDPAVRGFAGGAVFSGPGSTLTATGCFFSANTTSSQSGGGGIFTQGTTCTLSNCEFDNNIAGNSGGGITSSAALTMNNCTFTGNNSQIGTGGGLSNFGVATATLCTFSGNNSFGGGGGILNGGTLTLQSCTVFNNFCQGSGAGVFGNITCGNCIIAGNFDDAAAPAIPADYSGTATSQGFNFVGVNTGAAGFTAAGDQIGTPATPLNPKLQLLAYNGGPVVGATGATQQMLTNSPGFGSPVIDAGKNLSASANDQRGAPYPRTEDIASIANAAGGDGTDIGALEVRRFVVNVDATLPGGDLDDANLGDGLADVVGLPGKVSLRSAIEESDAYPDFNVIEFAIPGGGVRTIQPATPLPAISKPAFIDGYTQAGAVFNTNPAPQAINAVLTVQLSGASAPAGTDGLTVSGADTTVRGMIINRFQGTIAFDGNGVNVTGAAAVNDRVQGCFLGTDSAGNGTVSGNNNGVQVGSGSSASTGPQSAIIGTDGDGVNDAAERNVISNNQNGATGAGVWLNAYNINNVRLSMTGIRVAGNLAGLSAGGAALPNKLGVRVSGATSNFIGIKDSDAAPSADVNVISGNTGFGVGLDTLANSNVIAGNGIGVDLTLAAARPNGSDGVNANAASSNIIGSNNNGTADALEANVIAFNGGAGVTISIGKGNSISRNSIHNNTKLGIDLVGNDGPFGVTPNDPGDADGGSNDLQNFPVLTNVGGGTIVGTLNSTANTTFRLEFFANTTLPASQHGEGEVFLGTANVTTDGAGNAAISFPYAAIAGKPYIAATATNPLGSTSEFSLTISPPPTLGTYATTSVLVGAGTVVSPTAPPADIAGISTVTVTAPGYTGTLTVNMASGAVTIGNAMPMGAFTVTVTVTNVTQQTVSQMFTLNVGLNLQTITFPQPPNHILGDAPFALTATASSGLAVSYTIVSGPATVSGSTVTITGVGLVTVSAMQAGNGTFSAATPVTQTFTVIDLLIITSFAADGPTPELVNTTINFTAAANLAGTTFSFAFGDGASANGTPASHSYTTAGTYTVTVTAVNGTQTKTATLSLIVISNLKIRFRVVSGSISLASSPGNDSIVIAGILHVTKGQPVQGQTIQFNIGGVMQSFVLDQRGASGSAFRLRAPLKNGQSTKSTEAPFSLNLKHGSFSAALLGAGGVLPAQITITVTFGGEMVFNVQRLTFKTGGKAQVARLGEKETIVTQ